MPAVCAVLVLCTCLLGHAAAGQAQQHQADTTHLQHKPQVPAPMTSPLLIPDLLLPHSAPDTPHTTSAGDHASTDSPAASAASGPVASPIPAVRSLAPAAADLGPLAGASVDVAAAGPLTLTSCAIVLCLWDEAYFPGVLTAAYSARKHFGSGSQQRHPGRPEHGNQHYHAHSRPARSGINSSSNSIGSRRMRSASAAVNMSSTDTGTDAGGSTGTHSLSAPQDAVSIVLLYLNAAVPQHLVTNLTAAGIVDHAFAVDAIRAPADPREAKFLLNFSKLHLYRLTQFARVIAIDSDTLVLGDIAPLCALPPALPFAAAGETAGNAGPFAYDSFNAGVFSVVPSITVLQELLSMMQDTSLYDTALAEQGLLNAYYRYSYLRLPQHWNGITGIYKRWQREWHALWPEMRIVHFTMIKPWTIGEKNYKNYHTLMHLWHQAHGEAQAALLQPPHQL